MRKFYYLPQAHKTAYFDGKNKSKSPLNNFRKTPPRNIFQKNNTKKSEILGVTFSSKTSKKGEDNKNNKMHPTTRRLHYSHTNSELDQVYLTSYQIDNIQEEIVIRGKIMTQPEQYFAASLNKISQIRQKYYTNKINSELDEVLNMIKQEKLKIGEKMKILKRNNEYYQQKFDGYVAETKSRATNTDQLLDQGFQKSYEEMQVQVHQEELEEKTISTSSFEDSEQEKSKRNAQKQREYYVKLCKMLEQMKINYQQILPELDQNPNVQTEKEYKMLGDAQVIKIQKFFIKKLAAKLPPAT